MMIKNKTKISTTFEANFTQKRLTISKAINCNALLQETL